MNIYESSAPCTLSAADKKNYKKIVTSVMKANGTVNECDSVGTKKEYNRYFAQRRVVNIQNIFLVLVGF